MTIRGTTTGIQEKTLNIANKFFNDIENFSPGQLNYELNLFPRVEKFFNDMNKLGKEELSNYVKLQKYTTLSNITTFNSDHKQLIMDTFHCLTTLIVSNYSKSEILRYFCPEYMREEVGKPSYSRDSSRIIYWFQILAYWIGLLFNKREYRTTSPIYNNPDRFFNFNEAIGSIKYLTKKRNYIELIKADDGFHKQLDNVIQGIFEITEQPRGDSFISYNTNCRFNLFRNEPASSSSEKSISPEKKNETLYRSAQDFPLMSN